MEHLRCQAATQMPKEVCDFLRGNCPSVDPGDRQGSSQLEPQASLPPPGSLAVVHKPSRNQSLMGGPSGGPQSLPWTFPAQNLAQTVLGSPVPPSSQPIARRSQAAGGLGPEAILHVILSWLENDYPKMGSVDGSGQLCHINCQQ